MGLNLIGPKGETPIQELRRLAALRASFVYDGMGYYSGGPGGKGCDEDDMRDLNAELACSAIVALPVILQMRDALERIKVESDCLAKDCPPSPHACPACEIQHLAHGVTA